ncbi:hypothetical protein H5410_046926 [Solanum commersonii]|uniref:Uncharacterized protein n=1 Tax=Solanum commersonii TaxID=4109 RepID=A0A9J5XGV5_SOLCO|nr:hypothetical protein H5410_046926 [Solanum commersonii]
MAPLPPPSSYDTHFIRDNDDDKGVHTNQQLPPPSSYSASSIRVRENDATIGVQANQFQHTLQPTKKTCDED